MKDTLKSPAEHTTSAVKYIVPSVALSLYLINIAVHFFPEIEPIKDDVQGLFTIVINLLIVLVTKLVTRER